MELTIMHSVALLLCGYSIFSAIVILLVHFRQEFYAEQGVVRWMGVLLLLTLAGLQGFHFIFLLHGNTLLHHPLYPTLLFLVAPSFFLFSSPLLKGGEDGSRLRGLHFLPPLLAWLLPPELAQPLSFGLGSLYLVWLGYRIYGLRAQRHRFRIELQLLGLMLVIGLLVMALGLGSPLIDQADFIAAYSIAIGAALLLVNLLLGLKPRVALDIADAARDAYSVSTLGSVDVDERLQRLEHIMAEQQLFRDPDLDSTQLAEQLKLSRHQLSELVNTRLGKSVSRYIRELRVDAACNMLIDEPQASVLSIGLSVGFTSQSNFYQAFRELVGMTPGRYRKIKLSARTAD